MKNDKIVMTIVMAGLPSLAFAHPGGGDISGFWYGFVHPVSGLDHLLTMLAVGFWAAQAGGNRVWMIPATFVTLLLAGGVAGMQGVPLPYVEQGIAASLLMLGVLVAIAGRLNMSASIAMVGCFAVFHGHAHGAEIPAGAMVLAYSCGFALATIILHGVGIVAGLTVKRSWARYAGIGVAMSGVYFALL